jgi:hypothetical protein
MGERFDAQETPPRRDRQPLVEDFQQSGGQARRWQTRQGAGGHRLRRATGP